jgi:polysaccharide export outer membrane protein
MRGNALQVLLAALVLAGPLSVTASAQAPGMRSGASIIRPGDRIVLAVIDEPTLTDTFTVAAGPAITLPLIGVVSLAGISRDSLEAHLTAALGRVIRDPVVSARTLVRLAVLGEVARPGYFAVPADALLSDAITLAGGPTGNAEMRRLTLSRQGAMLQRDEQLRRSIAEGRTIDDLGISAGDELMVPRRRDNERTARIVALLVGIPVSVFFLTRM